MKKAGDDPKKLKRVQRKKAPEGQVTWTEEMFERLVAAEPEPLVSRMRVSHAMLLNVIARPGNPAAAMRRLLRDNHEEPRSQLRLMRLAAAQHRSLLAAGVVELVEPPEADGRRVRLAEGFQFDFALNQPLSAYALAVFDTLDPEAPTYALDVVSVIEATLEDPRPVLGAQEHLARGEAIGEMKAEGIEYDERMELLDEVTWPKPLEELLEHTYAVYRQRHPWASEDALSPKSVVRDMYERAMTFAEYVAFYGLTRSEGLVLRYLGDAFRALRQTVPEQRAHRRARGHHRVARGRRTPDRLEPARRVGAAQRPRPAGRRGRARRAAADTGADHRQRARLHRAGAQRDVPAGRARGAEPVGAARRARGRGRLDDGRGGVARGAGGRTSREHDAIDTGPDARGPQMLIIEKGERTWEVQQILGDPEGDHDWRIIATVDLAASDDEGELVLDVTGMGQL